MIVTATEFKTNFGKYLELIAKEDIFITRNGKTIAKVVNPQISAVDSLRGMLKDVPADLDLDSVREERLSFSGAGADGFVCEHCGAPITTGRFCEKCKSNMTDSLNEALDKPKPAPVKKQEKDGNRMRFLQ